MWHEELNLFLSIRAAHALSHTATLAHQADTLSAQPARCGREKGEADTERDGLHTKNKATHKQSVPGKWSAQATCAPANTSTSTATLAISRAIAVRGQHTIRLNG
jgi:hypothetical protein